MFFKCPTYIILISFNSLFFIKKKKRYLFTINSFKSKDLCSALFCVVVTRLGKLKILYIDLNTFAPYSMYF